MITMDLERRAAFIQGLRDFANFLEVHPDVPAPAYNRFNVFPDTVDELVSIAKKTSWDKEYLHNWFNLIKQFGEDLSLEISAPRELVCRKVPTGTVTVPARPAVPEHEEETYDWVCDEPLLAKA